MSKKAKKGRFSLSTEQYQQYQERRERPRGAFAEIWEPDTNTRSWHKVKPADQAVYQADRAKPAEKKSADLSDLFIREVI